jgi:hypothetical protein
MGIDWHEMADEVTSQGSSCPLLGPEPALGLPAKVDSRVIRGWKNKKHEKYGQSIYGQKQAKNVLKRPSAEKFGELLKLSRNQLQIMTRLLTGHCHLCVHPFKLGW